MSTLKTLTGRELKVTSNKRERTFRIKTESATFKTIPFSKQEFESASYWTGQDWQVFLRTDDYSRIK
jgi:hypothetical protein